MKETINQPQEITSDYIQKALESQDPQMLAKVIFSQVQTTVKLKEGNRELKQIINKQSEEIKGLKETIEKKDELIKLMHTHSPENNAIEYLFCSNQEKDKVIEGQRGGIDFQNSYIRDQEKQKQVLRNKLEQKDEVIEQKDEANKQKDEIIEQKDTKLKEHEERMEYAHKGMIIGGGAGAVIGGIIGAKAGGKTGSVISPGVGTISGPVKGGGAGTLVGLISGTAIGGGIGYYYGKGIHEIVNGTIKLGSDTVDTIRSMLSDKGRLPI